MGASMALAPPQGFAEGASVGALEVKGVKAGRSMGVNKKRSQIAQLRVR